MHDVLALVRKHSFVLALALSLALFVGNVIAEPSFVSWDNVPDQLATFAPLAIAALASMPSILSGGGGIDISIGPAMSVVNVVLVFWLFPHDVAAPLAIAIVLAISTAIGLVNGFFVGVLRYPPVVATLCMFFVLQGVALKIAPTAGQAPGNWTEQLGQSVGPVPGGLILVAAVVLIWLALAATPYVRALYSVGGSDAAAFASGVPVTVVRALAYGIGGLFAGIGGIALTALVQSADTALATEYTLLALAAVSLGGTPIGGGRGGLIGTLLGAAVIYLLQTFLSAVHVSPNYTSVVYGALLVGALVFGALVTSKRRFGGAT
ncbi:ABC transporter permease [Capillimicrobium parvum]|uniref:Ribose import permease protein RbsC n=1 Tax=Capillimicrobium parvum TaxID=2884022 RepID=A0A9E7BYL2_9ACTN|nr:hypothetical protein [Capillimicrobium parvum]UGS34516.1 Ribose import permease protein RbsC [Capillimicrobium parvum]